MLPFRNNDQICHLKKESRFDPFNAADKLSHQYRFEMLGDQLSVIKRQIDQNQIYIEMPPKRGGKNKKKNDDFDEEDEKFETKWANILQDQSDDEADAEEIYNKPNKTVYDYDFSHQKALDRQEEPKHIPRDKYAELTPEQKEELERIREQAKIDKAEKNKIKNEKKKQRKKEQDILKAKEQAERQKQAEDQKKVQEQINKHKKKQSNPWTIPIGLLLFLILMGVLQYNKEIHERLAKFKIDEQENYYEVLEADQWATDSEIKSKYKKLVLKYHPDRNPDCQNCRQKFDKIMQAWQVLGDPAKRKSYDQNSGYVSELKSASVTLTPKNYGYLVEDNKYVWMIQVFDSTDQYSRYFSQFWEQIQDTYGDVVKFGRVDIWHQSDMASYIPYSFQIFPGVYTYDGGYTEICSYDRQFPLNSLRKCIEEVYQKSQFNIVKEVPKFEQVKNDKILLVVTGRLRANMRVKAYHKMFENYYDVYYLDTTSTQRQAKMYLPGSSEKIFQFKENNKKTFKAYGQFLESFIVQRMPVCIFLSEFEERKCAIILNETLIESAQKHLPLSQKSSLPVVYLTDSHEEFEYQLQKIKNATELFQNFDIGVYEAGRVDLGYFDQADQLIPQDGQLLELRCKVLSWGEKLSSLFQVIVGKVGALFASST